MVGKDCVAIACDLRLGLQALTVSNNYPKIFQYAPTVYLGLTGLATDISTVSELMRYKVNMYRLREERDISPKTFANLVSSSLYERRFGPWFVGPIVAGIEEKTGKPFICGFDSIGCIDFAKDFIVSGTASDQLFGTCEGLWEPDLVSFRFSIYFFEIWSCSETVWSSCWFGLSANMCAFLSVGAGGSFRDRLAGIAERSRS